MDAAKVHIVAACQTPYGSEFIPSPFFFSCLRKFFTCTASNGFCCRSDDYMAALAKVHCSCRNWSIN
ncbi:hypothetical protein IEQ34_019876 [Dendrobium chrysotoxum]|uniref:Uncharacterized protein n=1 Tax=Dendrobium chrysotoxum TaxID=161865 RepID=A0AAV7G8I4_DENCH|nr:hypothetical protein IEQ34_019876 [Dendrobium chrysotoxum]